MNREKIDEQAVLIMEEFDFKQVHEVMKHQNIKYQIGTGKSVVLTEEQLRSVAAECLNKVIKSKELNASSEICGFEAEKIEDLLELRFVLQRVNPLKSLLNTQNSTHAIKKTRK